MNVRIEHRNGWVITRNKGASWVWAFPPGYTILNWSPANPRNPHAAIGIDGLEFV